MRNCPVCRDPDSLCEFCPATNPEPETQELPEPEPKRGRRIRAHLAKGLAGLVTL